MTRGRLCRGKGGAMMELHRKTGILEGTMRLAIMARAVFALALAMVWPLTVQAQAQAPAKPYAFNVLNQRTLALTAEYWNPILTYVSKKSGVPLE
jgi:hypothetical protein